MHPQPIGLIGVGLLGTAIAERLLEVGHPVVGFDIDPARQAELRRLGGTPTETLAELAGRCSRIVLSLPNAAIAAEVIRQLLSAAPDGAPVERVLIDTTTGSPDAAQAQGAALTATGGHYLDATLAGSSQQVRERDVVIMVGGDRAPYDQCRDIFEALARRVFYLGPSGCGARMKLVVNLVLGLNRAVLAEGLALASQSGIDVATALEVLRAGPARSAVMETKGEKMIRRDFTPQARLAQHLKDVRLILDLARQHGAYVPLTNLHAALLEEAVAIGCADADNSAIIQVYGAPHEAGRHPAE